MSISKKYNDLFLSRYSETDVFSRFSANFLVVICLVFFVVMFILFFINLKTSGLLISLVSSGTSCTVATITILLVRRGKVWTAGTFMTIIQSVVILLAGIIRTPEIALSTSAFFCFPLTLLAVIYTRTWINRSVIIYLVILMILNILRFDPSTAVMGFAGVEKAEAIFMRGSFTSIANLVMVYVLAFITMRALKISLQVSMDETKKSMEKNNFITRLMDTIKNSYQELTTSIEKTDKAVSNIFQNIQTESATIEELVASIEEISTSTSGIEETVKRQSESVTELKNSITELSGSIDSLQELGDTLQVEFTGISKTAETGNESSQSLDVVNRKTLENSNNIQEITGIIDNFFDRINLLSLNASIEAARAGEHGRGFAVVANEIGKLADSSSSELKKIQDLIDKNKNDVEFSNSIIGKIINFIESLNQSLVNVQGKGMDTLKLISLQKKLQSAMLRGTEKVFENSEFVKSSSAEQAVAIQDVVKSIDHTNALILSNNSDAEVLMDNYNGLKSIASNLESIIFADEKESGVAG